MSVAFEVDTNIVVFCLFVEVFDSGGGEERFHSKVLLEVLGRGIVSVVSLDESDGWICWDIQVNTFVLIQFLCFFFQFLCNPLEKFSQNSASPVTVDKVQLSFCFSTT